MICLNCGVVPPPTPAGPVEKDSYTFLGAFASPFATPTCMGVTGYAQQGAARSQSAIL